MKTVKITHTNPDILKNILRSGKVPILTCAHTDLIGCALAMDGEAMVYLASASADGDLIAGILQRRGSQVIRGSSNRRAAVALRQMLRFAKNGALIGTVLDGPKGPPLVPKQGVIECCGMVTGGLVFIGCKAPVGIRGRLKIRLKTWDKMCIPLPFGHIEVTFCDLPFDPLLPHWKVVLSDKLTKVVQDFHGELYS